jgi:hypothetical protein
MFVVCLSASAQPVNLDAMSFLVGTWSVDVESRLSLQGPWENSKGSSTFKRTLQQSLIEEEFAGVREGKEFPSKSFFAFNSQTNRFQRVFIDGPHAILMDFDGTKEDNTFVFDRTWTYPNGATVKLRAVYTLLSNDSFVVETMRMPADSKSWDVNGRMKYTRVK